MYPDSQANMSAGAAMNYKNSISQPLPAQPTRFSSCAGQLEARVAHVGALFERVARAVDRLAGPVPEEAQTNGKLQGAPNNTAAMIEQSIEQLEYIARRSERAVERLEQL